MYGATVGQLGILRNEMTCNQACCALIVDETKSHFRYVYYWLLANRTKLRNLATGAAQQNLSGELIKGLEVQFPSVAEQRKAGDILGSLDDKIAHNARTNATLEVMARAFFKSWFIDFDPVRAKAAGKKTGLPKVIEKLFPSKLVKSESGEVPEGWTRRSIYSLAEFVNGAAYKAFEPNGKGLGFPIVKIAELKAGITTQTMFSNVKMPPRYRIDVGDILFSWSGNPDTSIDTFVWQFGPAWLNQHIFKVIPKSEERPMVLSILKHLRPVFAELARNKQTTGLGHVTSHDMKNLMVVWPDKGVLGAWKRFVDPIQSRTLTNDLENQRLIQLRDRLLPKLISGIA